MKVRTRNGLLAVLLSLVFALTLCAGIWLALPVNVQADETSELVPLYGEDLQNCGAPSVKEKGTVWDKTQMRLYFSFKGISKPTDETLNAKGVFNGDKMWITDGDGVTMTVQQWKDANRIAWFAPFNGPQGTSAPDALEFWLAIAQPDMNPEAPDAPHPQTDANIEWMSKIKSVTILEGFQWETGAGPLAGATVKKTVTLLNNREAGWALSETNPELTTDVKMSVMYDNNVSNDRDASHIYLFFNFEGNAPANVSAFNITTLADSKVADYIEIDGTKVSTLLGNGTMGWVATWGETFAGPTSRTLLLNFNNADFKANIKKVTVKKGFTWVTRQAGAPEVPWGQADSYLENTNISLDEDVTIYNGGTKGWLSKDPNEGVTQSLTLLSQSEIEGHFNGSGDTAHPEYHQKLGPYWSPTWIRIYFKASSGNLPAGKGVGKGQYNNEENIFLTDSTGTQKSVKAWLAEGKVNWVDYSEHGGAQAGYGEIVICSDSAPEWLGGIKSVTVKTGFQWLDDKDAPAGFAAQEDITIYNGGMEKGWLAEDPDEPVAEKSVIPLAGDAIQSGPFTANSEGKKAALWDGTQMRLYFKLEGISAPDDTAAQNVYGQNENIILTLADGTSGTLKDWSSKWGWVDNRRHGLDDRSYHEIWINSQDSEWISSISYVTIKAGFQLQAGATPLADATIKDTVYLKKDANGNWAFCTEQDIPKPETALVPMYNTPSTSWDATQMRIYFTFEGMARPADETLNTKGILNGDKVEITDANGTTKTVAQWGEDGKVGWFAPFNGAHNSSTTTAEFWIAVVQGDGITEANKEWLAGIQKITIKAGFQWETAAGPLAGAVVKEDVTLWNGIEAGWQRYADSISAALNAGDVNQGDRLEDHLTVTAHYGEEEEAVTGYTLEGYDSTKAGQEQTVTVKYQDKEATVKVTVKAADKELTDIELSGKTEFTVKRFEKLDLSGLVVKAKYSDGTDETLTAGKYTVEALDTYQAESSYTLKVSYEYAAKTCEKNITVKIEKPDTSTGLEVFWLSGENTRWLNDDGSITQLRLQFKMKDNSALDQVGATDLITATNAAQHLKDYLLIDGQPYSEWGGRVSWIAPFSAIQKLLDKDGCEIILCISEGAAAEENKAWLAGIHKIELKAGFTWYTAQGDVEGAILKEDAILWDNGAAGWEKYVTNLDVTTTQTDANVGEKIVLDRVTVNVTYFDGTKATIPATAAMFGGEDKLVFKAEGDQKFTVTYQEKTNELTVHVTAKKVTGIRLAKAPDQTLYRFGTLRLNTAGISVKKTFEGGTEEDIDVGQLTFEGYDPYTLEDQTITVRYGDFTCTFTIKMEQLEEGLEIDWRGGRPYDESTLKVEGLTVYFDDLPDPPKAVKVPFDAKGVLEFVEINGRPATEYADGRIDWIGFYGWRFVIALKDSRLVWGKDAAGQFNPSCVYEEGTSEIIRTVKLLAGFQIYTANDGLDHWSDAPAGNNVMALEGKVVTHDVLLYNVDGFAWDRVLKQGADANLDGTSENFKLVPAADAIVLKDSGKLTYKKGEAFECQGFTFTLNFEDGGSQNVSLREDDVDLDSFDPNTLGKQSVKIQISGGTYLLEVTVTEDGQQQGGEQQGGEQEEDGGCGSVIGMNALLLVGGACAAVLIRRKRK